MTSLTLRRWHAYIGSLIAPSVLFFALTGALQIFGLHEAHGRYHPPVLLEKLSSLHKDQVLEKHGREEKGDAEAPSQPEGTAPREAQDESPPFATFALKFFFLAVSAGLTVSTCFGVWMSLQTSRRALPLALLSLGTLLPVVLILI